jgi:6-phospho-beta-glucosidase
LNAVMTGINHLSWTVQHDYDGESVVPLLQRAWERERSRPLLGAWPRRMLGLAATMESIPADYWRYYYFRDEVLEELRAKGTTRSQDILADVPDYWLHYEEQAGAHAPVLDPARSRGGIHELELALDVMDAVYNDRGETWPINVPNAGSVPGLPDDLVVETIGRVDRRGFHPLPTPPLPNAVRGLVGMVAEHQRLAADAAWSGRRIHGVRALAAHPLVLSLTMAETLYDEMAAAHRDYLPQRLLV